MPCIVYQHRFAGKVSQHGSISIFKEFSSQRRVYIVKNICEKIAYWLIFLSRCTVIRWNTIFNVYFSCISFPHVFGQRRCIQHCFTDNSIDAYFCVKLYGIWFWHKIDLFMAKNLSIWYVLGIIYCMTKKFVPVAFIQQQHFHLCWWYGVLH